MSSAVTAPRFLVALLFGNIGEVKRDVWDTSIRCRVAAGVPFRTPIAVVATVRKFVRSPQKASNTVSLLIRFRQLPILPLNRNFMLGVVVWLMFTDLKHS